MPPVKPDNKIDTNEARLIGDFLVTIGDELNSANNDLRVKALQNADKDNLDYYLIDDADAEYRMAIEVGTQKEGAGKKRESEVVMKASYKRISPPGLSSAPLNVLIGVIVPGERARTELLDKFKNAGISISKNSPILSLGQSRFWVTDTDTKYHYVVELSGTVKRIANLDELNKETMDMFLFLRNQLSKVYGE